MIFGTVGGNGTDDDDTACGVIPNGKSDIIGNVAIAVTGVACVACATIAIGFIIDDISVLMTGNPIKPVFVIISP